MHGKKYISFMKFEQAIDGYDGNTRFGIQFKDGNIFVHVSREVIK